MRIPIIPDKDNLCEQCVALCCRYYAFEIDKPKTKRDFEDIRWFMLHEGTIVFVEEGDWYVQVNRKCKALLPDNRCGIYENRPSICREYTTKGCDWHADEYDYDHLFTEPEQIQRFGKDYLAKKRKRRLAATRKKTVKRRKRAASSSSASNRGGNKTASAPKRSSKRVAGKKTGAQLRLRKTA